jgi:hypothetical protein
MRDSGSRSAADIAPIGAAAQLALGAHPAAVVKVLCVAHLGAALAWLDVAHNWGIALGIGIMALIEEVVFRRWLPDWLSPRLGITRAELVSALLFALAHWPWSAAPVFLIFGFAMSSVRSRWALSTSPTLRAARRRPAGGAACERWPGVAWVGSVGVGVCATGVEYIDEPALVLMLANLPVGRFEVFSGAASCSASKPYTALVHADPATPDLAELVAELSDRTASGYLFGGLASSRTGHCCTVADGVCGRAACRAWPSRATWRWCRASPRAASRWAPRARITACERNVVTALDGQPALACLLADLGLENAGRPAPAWCRAARHAGGPDGPRASMARCCAAPGPVWRRHAGAPPHRPGPGAPTAWRWPTCEPGMKLAFCERDVAAARRDLVRICSEIREELESPASPPPLQASAAPRGCSRPSPPRACWAPSTSAAPAAAGRTLAALRPSCDRAARGWATCRWWASSPAARSHATTSTATPAC